MIKVIGVKFKNSGRVYYFDPLDLPVKAGDGVIVETARGMEYGDVTGDPKEVEEREIVAPLKPVVRIATDEDKRLRAQYAAKEKDAYDICVEKIAAHQLDMKLVDVEYTFNGSKVVFYFTADERVDFRQLIKVLAEVFRIRVEMKQIGARQEAGRIGGIGPCGRPLCCATWMSGFISVATSAARFQDISLNPQNLAGQCAKLKCCINFEVNTYVEAIRQLPAKDVHLETKDATYYYFKADTLKREITYSTERNAPVNTVTLTAAQAFEVIALNKNGVKPDSLMPEEDGKKTTSPFGDLLNQDAINRFDNKKKKKKKKKSSGDKPAPAGANKPKNDEDSNKANGNGNGKPGGNKPRQGKPKPKRQQANGQPNGENQPRNGGNKPRQDKQPRPVKTFRPRNAGGDTAPKEGGNGQAKQNSAKDD